MNVTRTSHPKLFGILRDAGYRKHSASVYLRESTELSAPSWSEGSRSSHFHLMANGATRAIAVRARTQFGDQNLPWAVEFPTGMATAVVTGGTFRGKAAHWSIVIHPADAFLFGVEEDQR